MEDNIYNFKYKLIKNFLDEKEINLIKQYSQLEFENKFRLFGDDMGDDFSVHGDPLIESLMLCKLKKMQEITKLELLPTYAYYRIYTCFADLIRHKDRPACEISVTVQIDSSGEDWPIYMEGNPVSLNNGDALVYLGIELEHERKEFMGDYHTQCFLHYVNKNGKHSEWFMDKRKKYGVPK